MNSREKFLLRVSSQSESVFMETGKHSSEKEGQDLQKDIRETMISEAKSQSRRRRLHVSHEMIGTRLGIA